MSGACSGMAQKRLPLGPEDVGSLDLDPNHPILPRVPFFHHLQTDLNPGVPFLRYMTMPGLKSF